MVHGWVLVYWALGSIPSMVKDTSSTCIHSNMHAKYEKCWLVPNALLFRYWNQMRVLFSFFHFAVWSGRFLPGQLAIHWRPSFLVQIR